MSAKVAEIGPVRATQFVGGTYSHRSTSVDAEYTLNKYPEYMESDGARVPSALMDTPGLRVVSGITTGGGCRCLYTASNGRLFGVFGSEVVEFDANFYRSLLFSIPFSGAMRVVASSFFEMDEPWSGSSNILKFSPMF